MHVIRPVFPACLALLLGIAPANAWWQYAQWDLNESQLISASKGEAIACRDEVPMCARTSNGNQPKLFVPSVQMVGMPTMVAFAFDTQGQLCETVVLFPTSDYMLIGNLVQGIHGSPDGQDRGESPRAVWRDDKRGSMLTAVPVGTGTRLTYMPADRPRP